MNLQELASETLVAKNRRLRQTKCQHDEVHWSNVTSADGSFTNAFCFDCGKSWHEERPTQSRKETR